MPVAILKPFRSGNTLFFRGKIGNTPAGSVSIFSPFRIGESMVWRGKDCEGKVIYAWPFRSGTNLFARTVYKECLVAQDCNACFAGLPATYTARFTAQGFSICVPGHTVVGKDFLITKNATGYAGVPPDGDFCGNISFFVTCVSSGPEAGKWSATTRRTGGSPITVLSPVQCDPKGVYVFPGGTATVQIS